MIENEAIIRELYAAFNRRDIPAVLSHVSENVAWANGMDGGYEVGHEAVRAYWSRQWAMIQPRVEPLAISAQETGRVAVEVHQVVRDMAGKLILDETVRHLFEMEAGLVKRFDIEKAGGLSAISHS